MKVFKRNVIMPFGVLSIESHLEGFLCEKVIGDNKYLFPLSHEKFNIIIKRIPDNTISQNYRNKMLQKGIYLGHHIGVPALMYLEENSLFINIIEGKKEDYQKIIWNFALKFIFTIKSLKNDALHLKSTTLLNNNKAIILLGRGSSGKTTLSEYLQDLGCNLIGNTHCILKDNYVWGMNTWIRKRNSSGNDYYVIDKNYYNRDGQIQKIIIFNFSKNHKNVYKAVDKSFARAFITYFSSSIGNYDLKEDVVDYYTDDSFLKQFNILTKEQVLIEKMIEQHKIMYLSTNIKCSEGRLFIKNVLNNQERG